MLATGAVLAILAAACGGTTPAVTTSATASALPAASVEPFDEAALVAAAKNEPPLVALNNSGIVTTLAADFEKKYGLKMSGTKADTPTQVQQVTREVQSGNVKLGVLSIEDGATVQSQLIAQGYVQNYVPGDMVKSIPKEWQSPLVQYWDANIVTYNSELASCPVSNVWDLTDAAWKGKVAIKDPLNTPQLITWMSFLTNEPVAGQLAAAYQQKYGSALQTTEKNAGFEFIKRLAGNKPILGKSDDDAAAAVGAPGQKAAPVGLMSLGKHGEAPGKGNKLGVCKGIQPFLGFAYPRYAVIVKGTPSPNAAKLYVHFLMTVDGVGPSMDDHGGFSANADVRPGKVEFVGTRDVWQKSLVFLDPAFNDRAWQARENLSDFWRLNLK
ncbi:MAG TPA: ABC transporter substrate-binding protein [Candidatus Limnocylindria bacterium]|nr:ABC transporter substrate-binding protein [Candidatus Limnocylindria bacterium]